MIKEYSQAMQFLISAPSFIDKEEQISNLELLLQRLGSPQNKFKAIHVAGTNGKGSVCAYFNRILINAGYKTGLFTSPYLVHFGERIQINDTLINDNDIIKYVNIIKRECEILNINMSQFAYITAMMFMYFADCKVDYAVIEVGMGGRFDPTVLCNPCLCAITSISLDHTAILGNDYKSIALEKAGIIKSGIPVVYSEQVLEAESIILTEACNKDSVAYMVEPINVQCYCDKTEFVFDNNPYKTAMLGGYQAQNASIAIKGAKLLGINDDIINNSIADTVWKGRLQVVYNSPYVLVDGAHNPDAAQKLKEFVDKICKKAILICGMAQDKDIISSVGHFSDIAKYVFCVNINTPRGASSETILNCFKNFDVDGETCENVLDALNAATKLWNRCYNDDTVIIICGSLYLAGEFLSYSEDDVEKRIIDAKAMP